MKSIDKLHYKLPAGLYYDKWHGSNYENDAEKSFEPFVSWEFDVHQTPEVTHAVRSQKNVICIIQSLSGAPENPPRMSLVMVRLLAHFKFPNPSWHEDCLSNIQSLWQNARHVLLNHGNAVWFTGMWVKFGCTGESWAHIVITSDSNISGSGLEPEPNCCNRSSHKQNQDCCLWSGFHRKTRRIQDRHFHH